MMSHWLTPSLRVRLVAGLALALLLTGCASISEPGLPTDLSSRPQLGLRLRVTPSEQLPPSIGDGRADMLLVIDVREKQAAARADIRSGDVLLALDGVPVSGMGDAFAVMQGKRWGDAVDVTIFRDGEVQHMQVLTQPPRIASGS